MTTEQPSSDDIGMSRRAMLHRLGLSVGGITTSTTPATATTTATQDASEWSMYQYDAANSGCNPTTSGPTTNYRQKWRSNVSVQMLRTTPIVANGTVYLSTRQGMVHALSARSGRERWAVRVGGEQANLLSTPAVTQSTVYVGNRNGVLHAIHTRTGETRWQTTIGGIVDSPTVVDDTVYVGGDSLAALATADGTVQWNTLAEGIMCAPAVVDGTLFVGTLAGNIYAVDAATGKQQWRVQTGGEIRSSPAVVNGTVFVGSDDFFVYAIDAETGSVRWQFDTGSAVRTSPAVANGRVYVAPRAASPATMYALTTDSGELQWQYDGDQGERATSSPAVADGAVYYGTYTYEVYVLDGASGEQIAGLRSQEETTTSPAITDGAAYFAGGPENGGRVYAYETRGETTTIG